MQAIFHHRDIRTLGSCAFDGTNHSTFGININGLPVRTYYARGSRLSWGIEVKSVLFWFASTPSAGVTFPPDSIA